MEKNRDNHLEEIARLEKVIKTLPVKFRQAIYWALENLDTLEKMAQNSNLTLEEIQIAKADALAEESYGMLILLHITEYMKQLKENEEM